MMGKACMLFGAMALITTAAQAQTVTVSDPVSDFPISFTGTQYADLDVISFTVGYSQPAAAFTLSATMAGAITPANGGLYVIGVNNGTATNSPFASIGAPNVSFNQTILVQKAGTAAVGATSLATTISGATFTVVVPVSALTASAFDPLSYSFNLWPRSGLGGGNGQISDFAPNNAMLSAVPEPASWAMMIGGFGVIGGALRRQRGRAMETVA